MPVYFNKIVLDPQYDCVISISQVVPHEVAGMAGYSKNLVVGLGGPENIHKTHFLGAAYGMERVMGNANSPVRKVLNHAMNSFLGNIPIVHIITVLGMDESGSLKVRGLFIGNDDECYRLAARLSQTVNIHQLDKPINKAVVYLDPTEYKSTWLGNKSIYRTRMAIADGGELVVLAPGIKMFGEDPQIDALIRQFGYRGTPNTMTAIKNHPELKNNLSAAAHLIHGSSEDRFSITYCTGGLDSNAIEGVGLRYAPVDRMLERYNPVKLSEGYNQMPDGEEIYYISSPGSGLWALKEKFVDR
jgi:nickel-dependent lactate racemase